MICLSLGGQVAHWLSLLCENIAYQFSSSQGLKYHESLHKAEMETGKM